MVENGGKPAGTRDASYTAHLRAQPAWKRLLDVQAPYRWNLRRLQLGRTLEIGCGVGRNLAHLGPACVGIDHNPTSIAEARKRGLEAHTPDSFQKSVWAEQQFDTLLFAHVLEHMTLADAASLTREYRPRLLIGGRIVLIAPQEAGFRSDPTHVTFFDDAHLEQLLREQGCRIDRSYSFPLPRAAGRFFRHNEFVVIGRSGTAELVVQAEDASLG